MKKFFFPSIIVSILLVGCGGSGGNSNNNVATNSSSLREVKDVDAYIVNAKVCDSKGICAITNKNGIAKANFDLNSPLTSVGGFIDANGNGIKDPGELDAPSLLTPVGANIISPLTTLVAKGANLNKLSDILGVTPDEVLNEDPFETNNIKLVKAFNVVYTVIKENKIKELVKEINLYNPNASVSDLPNFGNDQVNVNIYNLAKNVLSQPEDIAFVEKVEAANDVDAKKLSEELEKLKENINTAMLQTEKNNIEINQTQNSKTEINNNPINSSKSNIVNVNPSTSNVSSSSTSATSYTVPTGKTDLPDFNANYQPTTVSLNSSKTDLPTFNQNVKLIPTNNSYNPSYTALPKRYYIKLNSFDEFVELKKINNKSYQFLNEKYFNVINKDFNDTKLFDINASYAFNDLNFTPDGNLNGTVFINLKDLNDSSEVNFTIKNVKFIVVNQKLIKTDMSNISVDVNSTCGNFNKNINAGTFDEFDINLSKVMVDYNESEFNQTNHDYSFNIDYNVSGTVLNLSGKYGIIKATVPIIKLDNISFLVPKNSDINLSIGKTNVANASCNVDFSSLYCYVDNSKNIYLYGHTPDEEAIKVLTLTLNNQGYKNSKSFYLEILKPADKVIVQNWNLSYANYSGYHIAMDLTGKLDNNIIDVNTSATPIVGSPENNVTVYLFNSSTDINDYIKFTFDANVYKSNDWFIIRRGDGKEIKFRVGDVDISNNTFYFK